MTEKLVVEIKNLSSIIQPEQLDQLFNVLCPKTIKYSKYSKETRAFLEFSSKLEALNAVLTLHQREILGKPIYAKLVDKICYSTEQEFEVKPVDTSIKPEWIKDLLNLTASKNNTLYYPKVLYKYPEPSSHILTNIVRNLLNNKSFYYQTLHLMNQLKLRCPFDKDYLEPGSAQISLNESQRKREKNSSSEDEIGEEEPIVIKKRKLDLPKLPDLSSQLRASKIQWTANLTHRHNMDDAFSEKLVKSINKEFTIDIPHSVEYEQRLQEELNICEIESDTTETAKEESRVINDSLPNQVTEPTKNVLLDVNSPQAGVSSKPVSIITRTEILLNKLSTADMLAHPLFCNYTEKTPTTKLYVKNIHKKVTKAMLMSLFGSFVTWDSDLDAISIDYFTEGRMKGQAFVQFPSLAAASEALSVTNGYMFKDRPIVVQFAKSVV